MPTVSESIATLAHLLPPVTTAALVVLVSYWVFRRRWAVRGARTFVVLLVVGGIGWQLLTIVHVIAASEWLLEPIVVADKFAGMVASALFVVFVSQYTNSGFHRRRAVQGLIGVQLGGFLVLWATTPWHGLLIASVSTVGTPFVYASMQRGPLYVALLAITYGLLALSYYLVVDFLLTTRDGAGRQVILLMLGALSVGTFNLLSVFELVPLAGFNYGSYGALPFILFTTVSVFRLGLLEIVPIARKTLVETLPDPVIVVDEDVRIADYNRAATDLWPSLPDHVGEPLDAACPELAERLAFPDDEGTITDEITLSDRTGAHHFSVLLSPVQAERRDDLVGYSILIRDVTELESSRRELERQNERLDRVAATVSHDLRNPLEVATGRLELLRERIDTGDERVADHVASIDSAHGRMGEIIDDVLTLAKEGREIDELAAVDVEAAAREAWANVETETTDLSVTFAGEVWADRSGLLTIFENLFRNAVEHAGDGATTVRVGKLADGFYVEDDGPGVPADERDRVFDHGYSTTDGGTGFGLAIVETVAETHGWSVELTDSPDGGARFCFRGAWVETGAT